MQRNKPFIILLPTSMISTSSFAAEYSDESGSIPFLIQVLAPNPYFTKRVKDQKTLDYVEKNVQVGQVAWFHGNWGGVGHEKEQDSELCIATYKKLKDF